MKFASRRAVRRSLVLACAMMLAAAVSLVFAPAAAWAGTNLDGTDPSATGCGQHVWTEGSFMTNDGSGLFVELRYSQDCGTAWTRTTCQQDSCGGGDFWIVRNSNSCNGFARQELRVGIFESYGTVHWSNQLYDGPCDAAWSIDSTTGQHTGWY